MLPSTNYERNLMKRVVRLRFNSKLHAPQHQPLAAALGRFRHILSMADLTSKANCLGSGNSGLGIHLSRP